MSNTLNILGLELNIEWCNKVLNIENVEKAMKLMPQGVDLVVLPEMFSTGFVIDNKSLVNDLAEQNTDSTITSLQNLSIKYNVGIAGTFIAKTLDKVYNRAFIIEPTGENYFYDKHHLFSIGNEQEAFTKGKQLSPIIRFRGWNIMPIVCYDLRFPMWCRNVENKYDILLVMANWPKARVYPWTQLLIARAIENQAYVCGINRAGIDDNNLDYGHDSSIIVDFKGKIISQKLKSNEIVGSLDKNDLNIFRDKFPTWKDSDKFMIEI